MDASERRRHAASEASDWFARLQSAEMECAEREQFVEWLRESHLHVAEMLRIAQIHGSLERFQRWSRISTGPMMDADNVVQLAPPLQSDSQIAQNLSPTRRTGHGPRLLALAAMLLVVVGTIFAFAGIRGHAIETERGERREVVLADGSVVQIDPQTRLRVKYADTARQVFLERGRALFHIARNPNRPFLVQADNMTVRAVGTAFGVEEGEHGVVVTVAEGKVAVVEGGKVSEAGEVFLTANQQLKVQVGGTAEPVREVDSARALAWAEGRLIFQNDEVGQAVAEFNRYSHVQLTVTDPVLARKPVSGVFNAAEPEAFIAFLQSVTPVEIVRDGDKSITIGSARAP